MTPEQPFAARVVAISASWIGYTLLLEEITDEEIPSMCVARIGHLPITYQVHLSHANAYDHMKHEEMHTVFLKKPIPVSKFSWEKGVYKIGRSYGEDDSLRQWYAAQKQNQREEYERMKKSTNQ